jgi:hypothetical protein
MNNCDNLWGPGFGLIVSVFIAKVLFQDLGVFVYAALIAAGLVGGYWIQQLIQRMMGSK